jgi:hypothetical protein
LIEPNAIGLDVANYMATEGTSGFYGFWYSSNVGPSTNQEIENYMRYFADNGGSGSVPSIVSVDIPQSGDRQYLFDEVIVSSGTISESAWYTFFIPDESIGGNGTSNRITAIDVKQGSGSFESKSTTSTWYGYSAVNPDAEYSNGRYRMYTTYVDTSLRLNNSSTELRFRGGSVG